jgi:ABC-type transport system substrate-binding protein
MALNNEVKEHRTALAHPLSPAVTRRSFLKGSLGAAVLAAGTSLTACGGSADDQSDGTVLRVGTENPHSSFDTQVTSNSWGASENICDTLVTLNTKTLELEPLLITQMPDLSDDRLTYSFELKDAIKFHDGSTMTSNDVRYSLTRLISKKAEADSFTYIQGADAVLNGDSDKLTGVQVQDDTHFMITLTQPYTNFLNMLAQFYASIYPQAACEAAGDDWGTGTNFIGSGPYRLESNDDNTEVVLKAFDDYHQGKPAIDEVDIMYIDDANTRMMSYKNGDIDLCFFSTSLLQQYQNDDSVKNDIVYYTPGATQFVNLNLNDPRFQDERIREALSLAINRQELADTVLNGAAIPCSGFIPPSETGHDDSAQTLDYDPDRARQLLQEAGMSDLSITAQVRSQDQAVMVALQNYWSQIGVNVDVQTIDAGMWRDARANGSLVMTLVLWSTLSFVGVEHMASYFYSTNASQRSSFYNSPQFDAYVDAARTATSEGEANEDTINADHQLVREDYATIPVVWPQSPYVLRPGYDGLDILVDFHYKGMTYNG